MLVNFRGRLTAGLLPGRRMAGIEHAWLDRFGDAVASLDGESNDDRTAAPLSIASMVGNASRRACLMQRVV
ncbi:hypothetical protein CI15_31655 [Paraburkholderia monticola]|uniref:Uncharacterized protein n=1 Tax=Paraburkholderia monticola TaxID=1399968 RepID=A0A149PAU0_9BURK|nr:hypothetical protein CI15_31655 [Paraburkholderia monticola]